MKKRIESFCLLLFIFLLTSCLSIPSSAISGGPRTLILNGVTVSETETDSGFTAWYCKDYVYEGAVLVEVGYFDLNGSRYGFILYDGGYTGDLVYFSRDGLNYRWDWGSDNSNYSFIIKPDGVALYYDFTGVPVGESTKARDVYKAYKR